MLTWDDYNQEDSIAATAAPEPAVVAAAAAAQEVVTAPEPAASKPAPAEPCLLYTSPSPRDGLLSRMPSSA